jgi:hypothetical protein
MRLKSTQRSYTYSPQIQHRDLRGAENITDSILLLRNENDRLREMAASLSMEAENIRRFLDDEIDALSA